MQIEHALAAVGQGTTSLGIKGAPGLESEQAISSRVWSASNGVVIATEKRAQPLVDDSMIEKVAHICPNIGIVYSGMGPDFRVLVGKARKSAQAYWKIYAEYPPTRVMVQEIATVMQEATQSGCVLGVRPTRRIYADAHTGASGRSAYHYWWQAGTRRRARRSTRSTPLAPSGRGRPRR